ncbi:MAG: hypothetical protein U9R01_06010 [candidate division WOR-3 bacterium]|nr:hypothetical protein [candidate division WOR-3 bacterium]
MLYTITHSLIVWVNKKYYLLSNPCHFFFNRELKRLKEKQSLSNYFFNLELIRCTASHIHIHTDLETDSVNEP